MKIFLLCLYITLDVANRAQTDKVSWSSPAPVSSSLPPSTQSLSHHQTSQPASLQISMGQKQSSVQETHPPQTQPAQGHKWDRKTPVNPSITYESLPSDLKHLADQIEKADELYKDPTKALHARCRALITVHRNLLPMLIAYNIGRPFKILGPAGNVAEVKVQSGFYVSRLPSVWNQMVKCYLGKSATLMESTNPRFLLPLF